MVSNDRELQQALSSSARTIKFVADISGNVSIGRLVNLDLAGYTLTGDVTYDTLEAGDLELMNGTIAGSLMVTTPNATVNNHILVTENTLVNDVSSSTWNEYANGNSLIFNDPDSGTHLNIQAGVAVNSLVLNSPEAVVEMETDASVANLDISEKAANTSLTVKGTVSNLNIDAPNVQVLGGGQVATIGGTQTPSVLQPTVTNHSPASSGKIENQLAIVGQSDRVLDVKDAFQDADGDALTYSASSSSNAVAQVKISGSQITIVPIGKGTATIRVIASDGRGGRAVQSFSVKCVEMISGSEIDVPIDPGTSDVTVDLSAEFSGYGDNDLQLKEAGNVRLDGKRLTVNPADGDQVLYIISNDYKMFKVNITVKKANHAPVVDRLLTDQVRKHAWPAFTVDASTAFKDEDGDDLTLTVSSSNNSVASASIDGKVITLTPGNVGKAAITVTAEDGKGGTSNQVFTLEVRDQGTPELFFSEYLDGGNGRIAIELFYKGDGNPDHKAEGYELEIHKYMKKTNSASIQTVPFHPAPSGMTYHIIESTFYDFFDLINAWYYNQEVDLYRTNEFYTTALVLKKDGRIVDMLGDINSDQPFLEAGGTILRNKGIYTGSQSFDLKEWEIRPKGDFTNFGSHSVE